MTVHMQESEAASDFSRFLDHLAAGDQVQLERKGQPLLLTQVRDLEEARIGPPRGSLEAAQAFFDEWHHVLADEEYVHAMKEAREVFNQPLEPRVEWD